MPSVPSTHLGEGCCNGGTWRAATKRATFKVKFPGYFPEDIARVDMVTVK
jgi:hypothetical protein